MRIDLAKFKEACQSVREEDAENGIPSYLDGIFHFYRCELADRRASYIVQAPATTLSPQEAFAEEVRARALLTNDAIRATPAQVRQIINLANDLEDWTSIGQHTLTRPDAAQIIKGMLSQIDKLDGE